MSKEVTTWGDIKLATLQKLFSANGTTIQLDTSNSEYIYAMPQTANEALELLSTAGKYIIKEYTYINRPYEPVFGMMSDISLANDPWDCTAYGAKAYYFRSLGKLSMTIYVNNQYVSSADFDDDNFTVHKGFIPVSEGDYVQIHFSSEYTGHVRNVALYNVNFETEDDIQTYEEYIHINMDEVVDDFYQLAPNEVYQEKDDDPYYIAAGEYFQEAGKYLVIPRDQEGDYTIYYRAYPKKITLSTPDKYELSIAPEVAALLPLYMASQLYKDDDNAIATTYRNEFEVGREILSQQADVQQLEEFTSAYGWS